MRVFYQVVLFALFVITIQCEEHLYAHGPFGKAHLSIEKPNPDHCNGKNVSFFHSLRSTPGTISELKVSSTNYSNTEKISISWKPLSTPCKDDFIGIYFAETPRETGACDYVDFEFVTASQVNSIWSMINLRFPVPDGP